MIDPSALNEAQREAVLAPDGPVLVIAGAGSGKTRTLVHRLAWLAEQGVPPDKILLLTFTRKASREMLTRAQDLIGFDLGGVHGGTFHSFAYGVLRQHRPDWATGPATVLDAADSASIIQQSRADLGIAKGNRSFPKSQHILGLLSKARNKEIPLAELIQKDAAHLAVYADDLLSLGNAYTSYKRAHNLLDYDDLLFELETLLTDEKRRLNLPFRHVLVDEYQDTNKVQARLVRLLAGDTASVMAVGDDAQSIYAFRGTDVRNILEFPRLFPGTKIIRLEENYRSTRPILDVANAVLAGASEGYSKNLFTRKTGGEAVRILRPLSDLTQARLVAKRISELLETHRPSQIAVLFRAGFHSYHLEVELGRLKIRFRKYGGLKYAEAQHVKDILAFVRLLVNPLDLPSFMRVAALCPGVGPKTAQKIYTAACSANAGLLERACAKYSQFREDLVFLDTLRAEKIMPGELMARIITHYQPTMEREFPDDWPRRRQGLDELTHIASAYAELDAFVADLSLESTDDEEDEEDSVVLSTIHSAKGLEWDAVIILDLVEDRFPSRRAVVDPEEFEEERRLMYVACTRARTSLELCVPRSLYDRQSQGNAPVAQSPFLAEVAPGQCEEWFEGYGGQLSRRAEPSRPADARLAAWAAPRPPACKSTLPSSPRIRSRENGKTAGQAEPAPPSAPGPGDCAPSSPAASCGYCRHRIFGRGKIVEMLPPDKCRVNFPGLGLKVIIRDFLVMED